jgi:hypothetical protein
MNKKLSILLLLTFGFVQQSLVPKNQQPAKVNMYCDEEDQEDEDGLTPTQIILGGTVFTVGTIAGLNWYFQWNLKDKFLKLFKKSEASEVDAKEVQNKVDVKEVQNKVKKSKLKNK